MLPDMELEGGRDRLAANRAAGIVRVDQAGIIRGDCHAEIFQTLIYPRLGSICQRHDLLQLFDRHDPMGHLRMPVVSLFIRDLSILGNI
ncbi:hypothetical protein CEB3_c30130 [Peptococcaceae bacterium CEB3]|nr:hypothetical protein CEB3_c30130 [Peptococcaceae bacterium CEB3]